MKTNLKLAKEYLDMYFEFNTELRTIVNEDSNIVTKDDLKNYSDEDVLQMADEARRDIKSQIGYLI